MNGVRGLMVLAMAGVSVAPGCSGSSGPAIHTVQGKLELAGGEIASLAGHSLEAASQSDPKIRAYGAIRDDGSFSLETLQAGAVRKGAFEGKYQARIVLSDDDPQSRARAAKAIHARYLQFDTSGLTFQVPAKEAVVLRVSRD